MDLKNEDVELKRRAELARAPYDEIARTAEEVGKPSLAASIRKLGERAAKETLKLAWFEGRVRDKAERDIAFREVREAHPNLLTLTDFKLNDSKEGQEIWRTVSEKAKTEERFPVEIVEYYPGEEVMVGDFGSAAELFTDPTISSFLQGLSDWLEASLEEYTHGLEESMPEPIEA